MSSPAPPAAGAMEALASLLHRPAGEAATSRVLRLNEPPAPGARAPFAGNSVSTTKYNLATFLPKALFEQYRCALPAAAHSSCRAAHLWLAWLNSRQQGWELPRHGAHALMQRCRAGAWPTSTSPWWPPSRPRPSALSSAACCAPCGLAVSRAVAHAACTGRHSTRAAAWWAE